MLLTGLLLFCISSIGCALSTDINSLIVFRFFQALGGSAGPVLGRAMVRDIHGPKNSGKVLSHIASAMALAPAIAPIAGGFMSLFWGWTSIFWFLALFGILGAALLHFKIEETAPEEYRHAKSVRRILGDFHTLIKDPGFMGFTLTCTLSFTGLVSFLAGSSFVIIEYFAIPQQWFGMLFTLVVLGYMSGTLLGGRLSHSKGYKYLVGLGSVICLLSGMTMLGFALTNPTHVATIIAPMMIFMCGVGLVMPQSMAGALAEYPHIAGSASGLLGFIQMASAGTAGVIVGHGYDGTPIMMSSMVALSGILTFVSFMMLVRDK